MKMKKIAITILFMGLVAGCASTRIKHLGWEEFLGTAKLIEQPNSALWVSYLGISRNRVYLEYQDMLTLSGKPKTVVYWTELDKLPVDVAKYLKAGYPIAIPWEDTLKKDERTTGSTVPSEGAPSDVQ